MYPNQRGKAQATWLSQQIQFQWHAHGLQPKVSAWSSGNTSEAWHEIHRLLCQTDPI